LHFHLRKDRFKYLYYFIYLVRKAGLKTPGTGETKMEKKENCKNCNRKFLSVRVGNDFCSRKCYVSYNYRTKIKPLKIGKYKHKCKQCDKWLVGFSYQKYCSVKCRNKAKHIRDKKNPEFILKLKAINNRESTKEKRRKYYQKNKNRFHKLYKKNIPNRNKRTKERKKEDIKFYIRTILRTNTYRALRTYTKTGKIMKSTKYGIDYKAIIEHLKPFPEDLSKYHIDHIRPLCSFDLTSLEQVKEAFAPENHQWLTVEQNLRKGGKWNGS